MAGFLRERKGICTEPFTSLPEAIGFTSMRYITLIIAISFFSSCITLQAPEVKSVSNIQTSGLLSAQPHLTFEVVMYNPNAISVGLSDFNLEVMYGSLSLATLHLDTLRTKQFYGAFKLFAINCANQQPASIGFGHFQPGCCRKT